MADNDEDNNVLLLLLLFDRSNISFNSYFVVKNLDLVYKCDRSGHYQLCHRDDGVPVYHTSSRKFKSDSLIIT